MTDSNSRISFEKRQGSPWETAGCFLSRHPVWVSLAAFALFWLYRSQIYSGDGDQLSRMVEAGLWMVQTELASQAVFQLVYKILRPWGWDGFAVINLVSCAFGALSVWVLLRFHRDFVPVSPFWTLGLFCSSGLILFCIGHTEYYTQFLALLLLYGYLGVGYLRGTFSPLAVALGYSAAGWMHLGILFALPSLLILPLLKRKREDYLWLLIGLGALGLAFVLKTAHYTLGIYIQGLSPSVNFVPFRDKAPELYYNMFEWGHLADVVYAWTYRSWIFWPFVIWAAVDLGWRRALRPDRLFLGVYTLCFTLFVLTWHPNLGIEKDWDLFAIEAAPCLLWLLLFLPDFLRTSFHRYALALPTAASVLILFAYTVYEAQPDRRGYGSLRVEVPEPIEFNFTLNGHLKDLDVPAIREGTYSAKLIDQSHDQVYNFYVHIAPRTLTRVVLGPKAE